MTFILVIQLHTHLYLLPLILLCCHMSVILDVIVLLHTPSVILWSPSLLISIEGFHLIPTWRQCNFLSPCNASCCRIWEMKLANFSGENLLVILTSLTWQIIFSLKILIESVHMKLNWVVISRNCYWIGFLILNLIGIKSWGYA